MPDHESYINKDIECMGSIERGGGLDTAHEHMISQTQTLLCSKPKPFYECH